MVQKENLCLSKGILDFHYTKLQRLRAPLLFMRSKNLIFDCRNQLLCGRVTIAKSSDFAAKLQFGQRIAMDTIKQEKVRRFEEFIDRRLKPDLVHAIAERDKVFEQQKIFSDLKRNIENLEKNNVTNLKTLVNIGSEVYLQADVPDTTRIFVDVGLGFHVEFTWSEALNYISAKEEKLARQIEEYTRLVASIKAQIKMVCEGIRELLQIPPERAY
ncbi:LOW QUALITY PROTEIN: protein UXT homolog [Solanum pennellii]|uniref:LOW QUALITY PROTEIN: protein UXT homolog n=1 Tax=Solanum pennellii TaxID=28526 RepID=A0ABM1GUU4_SOLPN|nr:LOW QUALITY PROTEIN: protein UXT homolog [Solanum pennellii]